jgi:hypothetical protein
MIVPIDNIVCAERVIKTLRSSSNSCRNYKQNALKDDFIIQSLDDFNRVVSFSEVEKEKEIEKFTNELLVNNNIRNINDIECDSSDEDVPYDCDVNYLFFIANFYTVK